jgi:hypothetical protein
LACAEVRARIDEQAATVIRRLRSRRRIRRHPGAVLLRCRFDIRTIFEDDTGAVSPARRDTRLVVDMPRDADNPRVFEVEPVVYDLLSALDDWIDPAVLGKELAPLVRDLTEHALVEVSG